MHRQQAPTFVPCRHQQSVAQSRAGCNQYNQIITRRAIGSPVPTYVTDFNQRQRTSGNTPKLPLVGLKCMRRGVAYIAGYPMYEYLERWMNRLVCMRACTSTLSQNWIPPAFQEPCPYQFTLFIPFNPQGGTDPMFWTNRPLPFISKASNRLVKGSKLTSRSDRDRGCWPGIERNQL